MSYHLQLVLLIIEVTETYTQTYPKFLNTTKAPTPKKRSLFLVFLFLADSCNEMALNSGFQLNPRDESCIESFTFR